MQSFTFHCPTEVVFGRGAEDQVPEKLKEHGAKRILIVYGGGSVVRSGLLGRIECALTTAGFVFLTLGGVKPNPRVSLVREGVREILAHKLDFILAVGGGSVIDTAKGIAHGAANPGIDVWDFWCGRAKLTKSMPVGAVLTHAAAGSETSDSSVLTDEDTGKKLGLNTPLNRPVVSFLNPELTYSVPKRQMVAGIADIYMHTLERYFTAVKEKNTFTDLVAESLLKNVIAQSRVALENPQDYDARSEIMWCGSVSHCNFTELGRCKDFSVHRLGHELSGMFDVTHGESLTALWGWWAQYVLPDDVPRFAHYAEAVWGVTEGADEEKAKAGIEKTVAWFRELGMPTDFSELGIGVLDRRVLEDLADSFSAGGTKTVGSLHPLGREEAIEVYKLANH